MVQYVSGESTTDLIVYLRNHEEDIGDKINDFDDLSLIFYELIGHHANPSVTITKDELRFIQKRLNDLKEQP